MKTKELAATFHRKAAETVDVRTRDFNQEVAAALDRLAAIEAALPDEVRHIASEHAIVVQYGPTIARLKRMEAHEDRGTLLAIVGKQQERIEALTEGVRIYRAADCPFGQPVQIREWETKHGHLVPQVESPTKSELNSAPDQVN